jgi:outer membrane lipase/esterase
MQPRRVKCAARRSRSRFPLRCGVLATTSRASNAAGRNGVRIVGAGIVSLVAGRFLARAGLIAICATLLLSFGAPAKAQPFTQFIGFGDSTLDSGWYFTHTHDKNPINEALYRAAQAAGGGVAMTPGGRVNSQILAGMFGLSATAVGLPGGTNYAAGGAANIDYANYQTLAPNTISQIQSYLASTGGVANPNALYMISSGGNDVRGAICPNGVCAANASQLAVNSANALSAAIAQLRAVGARNFVVAINFGAGPLGNGNTDAAATTRIYDQALYGGLAAAGINFVPVSGRVIADAIGVDPSRFGLTNATPGSAQTHQGGACINPAPGNGAGGTIASAWAASCTTLVAPNAPQTYLYADDLHYSAAGQLIEGTYAYSLIVAPTEMSYLAEAPVTTRRTVVDSILSQIPISQWQRTVGSTNAWISGDLSSLSMASNAQGFPSDPGTPGMVTSGIDYLVTPNWLVGAAVSVGTTRQSFSLGGDFRQNEYAVSAYAAYVAGPLWFDTIASYGGLRYDVNRIVPIGIATVSNTSSPRGDNASFAAEIGYDFTTGFGPSTASALPAKARATAPLTLTHGPVAGIVLQRISVNGFAETDPFAGDPSGGLTALAFGNQRRNSAITELGYQASLELGFWRPYAKLVWNHELAATDRLVTATVPEIAFAPPYAMPAVTFGKDWVTGTLGTRVAFGRGVTGYASLTGQSGQSRVASYGGQLGLNVALDTVIVH